MTIVTIWARLGEDLLKQHAEVMDLVLVDGHDHHAVGLEESSARGAAGAP